MIVRLHYNKYAKDDRIWTVHTSKQCIPAREVEIIGKAQTEYKPEKKNNPKAFLLIMNWYM